jgi:acetylglutamate kinase
VVKVFAGSVNAQLVTAFRKVGGNPVGLSGLSAGLVDAVQLDPELGQVGKPVRSDGRLLEVLVREGYLPVVACVAGDAAGNMYNVNGDQMAVACAQGFQASKLVFLTDVDGVRDASGQTCAKLTVEQSDELIKTGVASGGMQAKLEAASTALRQGIHEVVIAPGAQPGVVENVLAQQSLGTRMILK